MLRLGSFSEIVGGIVYYKSSREIVVKFYLIVLNCGWKMKEII